MPGVINPKVHLFSGRRFVELFAMPEGDDPIFATVYDEHGALHLFDVLEVIKLIPWEDLPACLNAEGGGEGAF